MAGFGQERSLAFLSLADVRDLHSARLDEFFQSASSPNRIPVQGWSRQLPFAQCQPVHATKAPHGRLIRKKWGRQTPRTG